MTARAIGDLLNGTSPKSYAPSPMWKGSTTDNVRFVAISKKDATRLYYEAERFEQQTRLRGRQDGALGRNALMVLRTLVFKFLNFRSGRLDPSYEGIAYEGNLSVRSVGRGLARLKAAGVLNWVQRCLFDGADWKQRTNAYAVRPASQWRGYRLPPPVPAPHGDTWGQTPPIAGVLQLAHQALQAGLSKMAQAIMESDPGDGLAAAMARLGRLRAVL